MPRPSASKNVALPPQNLIAGTKPESAHVSFCSWGSFAAAYAIAHLWKPHAALFSCGRALRPWLWQTLLPAAVLDPSGQASPAERQA
jgi:hypothetical protein